MAMDDSFEILSYCQNGNFSSVQQLLSEGISPDIQDREGVTPLQMSAANGWDDIILFLLSCGAQVDLPNNCGWTPLMHAALHGHTCVISLLLRNHAKVNVYNKLGLQPLVAAAWNGHLSAVKILLDAGAVIDDSSSSGLNMAECDMSALMTASLKGHDVVLRTLLEKGASVNLASPITGLTPLMCAACNGFKQAIEIIAEWGGDANKLDICERTAQDIATIRSKREVKAYLENMTATWPKVGSVAERGIFQAVRNGDIAQVKMVLQQDLSNLNSVDYLNGSTPLIIASTLGHLDIVCLLLSYGANIDVQDCTNGWTALMHAVFSRHVSVAECLLQKGANVDIQAKNGYTVLDLVCLLDSTDFEMPRFMDGKLKHFGNASKLGAASANSTQWEKIPEDIQCLLKPYFQQGHLKGWHDGLTQHFNHSKLSKSASKMNDTYQVVPEIRVSDDASADDVFVNDQKFSSLNTQRARLSLSLLLSPNKHLSESLQKHSLKRVLPPLLSNPTREFERDQKNIKLKIHQERCFKGSLKITMLVMDSGFLESSIYNILKICPYLKIRLSEVFTSYVAHATQLLLHFLSLVQSPSSVSSLQIRNLLKNHEKRRHSSSSRSQQCLTELSDLAKRDQDHLSGLLKQKSLQKYIQKFKDQEIDLEAFQYLNEDDLEELGIYSTISRQKIMEMINIAQNTAGGDLS